MGKTKSATTSFDKGRIDAGSDGDIARIVRKASRDFYGDRCAGLSDHEIGAAYRHVRAKGVTVEHSLEVCSLLRPGDDPGALADTVLVLKPYARERCT